MLFYKIVKSKLLEKTVYLTQLFGETHENKGELDIIRKINCQNYKNKKKDFSKSIDLNVFVWYNIPEKLSK